MNQQQITFPDRIEDDSIPQPISQREEISNDGSFKGPSRTLTKTARPCRRQAEAWPRLPQPYSSSSTLHQNSSNNNNNNNKRYRKLLPLSIFLRPLANPSNPLGMQNQSTKNNSWWGQFDKPDTVHLTQILAALLLTTVLGFFSALDAKYHCLKHETSALGITEDNMENDDEIYQAALDEARHIEADGCLKMFRGVCLPVLGVTIVFGLIGLWILLRKKDGKQHTPTEAVRWMAALLVVLSFILVAQTYLVTRIMLRPRMQDDSENPFHSLGAVDVLGQIGDNANLYYHVWVSEILIITLVYQTVNELARARRAADQACLAQGLLPATSWWIMDEEYDRQNHQSRHTWYKSIYKLRVRTGIWTAALITCLVLTASAQYVWRQFMWPYVLLDDGANNKSAGGGEGLFDPMDFSWCQTMAVNSNWVISVTLCRRTVMAWFSGAVSFLLSAFSIGMHLVARARAHGLVSNEHRQQLFYMQRINIFRKLLNRHRVPLGLELILSLVLSLLLGFNAALSTGVQGPATKLGNLYYASWGAFLLLVRIAVGCLEEWYEVEPKEEKPSSIVPGSAPSEQPKKVAHKEPQAPQDLPVGDDKEPETLEGVDAEGSQTSFETETSNLSGSSSVMMDSLEKERVKRLRTYFFLCIFSTCCASAAFDAAVNQRYPLTKVHRFMMISPCVVAFQSLVLFCLCLSKRYYLVASHVCVGGILSVLSFALWLADLILTMHSEDSWAVNGIGEIRMANLYYFTWASILTAGLQMMSYINALFGMEKSENMALVWVAICKVCFVTLGASLHIWHNIADKCDIAELTTGAVTFCSRTVLAIVVSTVGTFVGGLVAFIRTVLAFCPSCDCRRIQAHAEMFLSIFFVLLFGATVALVTGIGGPGQSVGDLFYSAWLSFAVSIYIFANCYYQIRMEDTYREVDNDPSKTQDNPREGNTTRNGVMV